ncbi:MAG: FmdB family zinc ribbon protein [Candidatus Methylomirabilales bacterium]
MPLYQYACQACGVEVEVRHRMSESPPGQCAACGGMLERVFTAPRLSFGSHSSPTAAKYAKMTAAEEVAHEQADFESLRLSQGGKSNASAE